MDPIKAVILGLTQGITEFIPVSSSGHLELVQGIFGDRAGDFHLFLELINFGTLFVLLIYYRKRIAKILKDIFAHRDYKLLVNVVITCIPAVLLGLAFSDIIESSPFFSNLAVVATAMALIGFAMIFVNRLPKLSRLADETKLSRRRALYIGLAQALALIPGTSRSGSTILAGRLVGLNSKSAADYSFLVSIPIMLGVCAKSLFSASSRAYFSANFELLLLSNAIAFVSGLFAINIVMRYLKRKDSLKAFGWYRVLLAAVVYVFVLLG